MGFQKAVRSKAKTRVAIDGASGSGKTYSALLLAKGIGGKIAMVDTENKSGSLYAGSKDIPEFDVMELSSPFTPERFMEAVKLAEDKGYDIVILDLVNLDIYEAGYIYGSKSIIQTKKIHTLYGVQ